jgi:VIT1/CCC1 family predicted Fe2+/Mn2+ transporter
MRPCFLLGTVFDRGRLARLGRAIAQTPDEGHALAIVADELDETLVPITSDEQRIGLYRDIVANVKAEPGGRATLHRVDFLGALAVFVSVFIASLPAALPYLVIQDPWLALRVSNALLIGALFWAGHRWAGYTNVDPRLAGVVLTLLGLGLVLIALALGG